MWLLPITCGLKGAILSSCHGEQEGPPTPRLPNYMGLSFHSGAHPVSGLSHPLCWTWQHLLLSFKLKFHSPGIYFFGRWREDDLKIQIISSQLLSIILKYINLGLFLDFLASFMYLPVYSWSRIIWIHLKNSYSWIFILTYFISA